MGTCHCQQNRFIAGCTDGTNIAAWTPLALSIQREPDAQQRYATVARSLIGVVLLGALALGLFSTEILLIFTRAPYLPASPYVGFLAYIHVFSGFSMVLYTSALARKQLKAISLSTLIGAVTNIVLNFALIPPYGVWGATIATAIGYGVPTVCLGLLRKHYPVPYRSNACWPRWRWRVGCPSSGWHSRRCHLSVT